MESRILVIAGLMLAASGVLPNASIGEEARKFRLEVKPNPGKEFAYHNVYRMSFFTDRAMELLGKGRSTFRMELDWAWGERERTQVSNGDTTVAATVEETDDLTTVDGVPTVRYWTIKLLEGKDLTWKVSPRGEVTRFETARGIDKLEVETVVRDVGLFAQGHYYPPLPERPVGLGDSWTVNRVTSVVYEEFRGFEARVNDKATLKLKGLKKRKGRQCAEIQEDREFDYKALVHTGVSLVVLEGHGKATGSWLFDVDDGVVVEHKGIYEFRPDGSVVDTQLAGYETQVKVWLDRRLKE